MKVYYDFNIYTFEGWSGAKDTLRTVATAHKMDELEQLIEDIFCGEASETEINDFLWFEDEYILECLGINEEDED